MANTDPERIRASFNEELERESRAREDELLTTILSRDAEEGLRAKKRLYRRAVLDRRILLWLLVRARSRTQETELTQETAKIEPGRCVP